MSMYMNSQTEKSCIIEGIQSNCKKWQPLQLHRGLTSTDAQIFDDRFKFLKLRWQEGQLQEGRES